MSADVSTSAWARPGQNWETQRNMAVFELTQLTAQGPPARVGEPRRCLEASEVTGNREGFFGRLLPRLNKRGGSEVSDALMETAR